MALGATILDFQPLNPSNIDGLDFSVPWDNGIRILAPEYCTLDLRYPYYGDTVNLKFWKLLGIMFGASWPPPSVPLTRQDGYKYIYNHTKRTFDAYDASDTNFVHITGITSMADMNIDFTIYKSHQFQIFVEPSDIGGSPFIFPAHLPKKLLDALEQKAITAGIQNNYLPDRTAIFANRNSYIQRSGNMLYSEIGKLYQLSIIEKEIFYTALNYFWTIDWEKNAPTNALYVPEKYKITRADKIWPDMKCFLLNWDILLPIFAIYPDLMPVERAWETQNNRPVYEPWVIWGFLKFLYKYRTIDLEDEFEINIFDLSPRFS